MQVIVRAISHVLHWVAVHWRLLYYNLTLFSFHRLAPLSTTIYGRLRVLHRPCRISFGKRCRIGDDVYLATSLTSTIEIADDVNINLGCVLVAMEGIKVGPHTAIAEYVSIRDQEHNFVVGTGTHEQGFRVAPVEIGKNVWIGRGVYIGPGSKIGDNSIIGANSVVRGVFPPNVLIAGAPAIVRKQLASEKLSDKPVTDNKTYS